MEQTAAAIPNIRQLPFIPKKGKLYISVNLAGLDVGEVWAIAKQVGFSPELAYLQTRFSIQIHALLLEEDLQIQTLSESHQRHDQIQALMDAGIDPEALRITFASVTGRAA